MHMCVCSNWVAINGVTVCRSMYSLHRYGAAYLASRAASRVSLCHCNTAALRSIFALLFCVCMITCSTDATPLRLEQMRTWVLITQAYTQALLWGMGHPTLDEKATTPLAHCLRCSFARRCFALVIWICILLGGSPPAKTGSDALRCTQLLCY